ncbi:MAG: DUF2244 domain-containing protein [Gammaproteobacteria bacterium]|nr:DUF2244 domain-containing protein [Gammaproteobacteria bacterium]
MIRIDTHSASQQYIVLAPNLSSTWRANLYLIGWVATLAFGIAIGFALRGAWMILPFAGLEVLAMVVIFYIVTRRGQRLEVIRILEQEIIVEHGHRRIERRWCSARFYVRVVIIQSPQRWYLPQVIIRGQPGAIEVGEFLNEAEKNQLIAHLRQSLTVVR